MSFRGGFLARSFFFLGTGIPDAASFGYMEGSTIPYVPGSGEVTQPSAPEISPSTAGAQNRPPSILGAHRKKRR